ncbi:transcription factor bHLH18 [Sorghum bicolor]|uniref:BHLH domain-containing protein n=1 Tax=Sorghum bicolor TaxID=4558 RepID=A0A1Z5S7Y2_SORBI|nr:transcription factor bHLH18 [Sorghum bicolor]OQU92034.1 hypothetical protein SORBI_3001G278500 [Sorghum bicolor]|eukprot:XP_002467399.2 transcription factor bHLH18 [Sorghum bicolor]
MMDSSANKQWLAELEKDDDLGELELIDPLSMQQLAESLANELWSQQQPPQQEQRPTTTGFSFAGVGGSAATGVGCNNILMSFTNDGGSSSSSSTTVVGTANNCCPPLTMLPLTEKKQGTGSGGGRRASSSLKEHVVAERKRREKMHNQFATLASIVPDITKTDKVSVLGSTIEYVHHLKDRLKTLQQKKEHHHFAGSGSGTAESESPPPSDAQCCTTGTGSKDDEAVNKSDDESPKIEVDVRGKTILLRVVCRQKKGVLIMVLTELIENHGLSIINTNVVPFAESSLNITITAQIEDGTSSTGELVNNITSALNKVG